MPFILHVDMDSFFASCEELRDPSLKGKPVIVGADPKEGQGRGVVSTCNYTARKYGVHSAMPISKAYRLCPTAVFLRPDFSLYKDISNRAMAILREHADRFQQVSIDEAYLDVSSSVPTLKDASRLAKTLQGTVQEKLGVTCSIGVSINKLLAKIASDYKKPAGITVIREEDKEGFLATLPIRKLHGVGPKSEEKLKDLGIETIGHLAAYPVGELRDRFGMYGDYLYHASRGLGSTNVSEDDGRVSYSKETTFMKDEEDFAKVMEAVGALSAVLAAKLRRDGVTGRTIAIKIRFEDFTTLTRSRTLLVATDDRDVISRLAQELCAEFQGKKIRLVGVSLSGLQDVAGQLTLPQVMERIANYK